MKKSRQGTWRKEKIRGRGPKKQAMAAAKLRGRKKAKELLRSRGKKSTNKKRVRQMAAKRRRKGLKSK